MKFNTAFNATALVSAARPRVHGAPARQSMRIGGAFGARRRADCQRRAGMSDGVVTICSQINCSDKCCPPVPPSPACAARPRRRRT
ncbi:hypothetical protein EVAR_103251_1 [Eumeta japonica]|uniref:Uncharacterized protein n=1 Tax=Eumeta variegata TaxID=151549 RepID=A0A4C2A4D1_EUMVA|nr:hypothetical protein EVAR_103251_1 [Eumeta japonica]